MARFFVKGVRKGSVLNYEVIDNIMEVADPEHIAILKAEPHRFEEIHEEPAKKAGSSSTSDDEAKPKEPEEKEEVKDEEEEKPKKKKKPRRKRKIKEED